MKGWLDPENLKRIDEILCGFEREYRGKVSAYGKLIVQERYLQRALIRKPKSYYIRK